MTREGILTVQIKSDSWFLGGEVPVEVRDSQMRLVNQSSRERRFELPIGLYEVSAVLEDGRKYRQLVQVQDQEEVTAELGLSDQLPVLKSSAKIVSPDFPPYESPRYTQKIDSLADTMVEPQIPLTTRLIDVNGASVHHESPLLWTFSCLTILNSVPFATIEIDNKRIQISLPISPEREFPYNSCAVKVEVTRKKIHINAWISKERTVANALQNMIASGYMLNAADIAANAVHLLRDKYSDPTGAVLGALTLYKVGRLGEYMSWIENLARDFSWMPDGKVMLANLLYNNKASRKRALALALEASSQRMLYAECYSLLLDLLRRWAGDARVEKRKEAVSRLASLAPYIDWESICLNHTIEV